MSRFAKTLNISIGLFALTALAGCDSTQIAANTDANRGVNTLSLTSDDGYCESITVDIAGTRLLGKVDQENSTPEIMLDNPIPDGNYRIRLHYEDETHPGQADQLREQWYVEFYDKAGDVVLMTPETNDLPSDEVISFTDFEAQVVASDVYSVKAFHAYESESYNSIHPTMIEVYPECTPQATQPVDNTPPVTPPIQNQPPVITLNGDNPLNVLLYDLYTDPGATALDNEDGDITSDIVVGGDTVDMNTPGTYVVTYDVTDSNGNAATQVSRTVIVHIGEEGPALLVQ